MSASFKTIMRSTALITHLGFIALLTVLSFISLSAVGLVTSLYSFYDDLVLINGSGLVISSYAVSPLTSVISEKYLLDILGNIGRISVEPIIFSVAYTRGRVVVVRGINNDSLVELVGWDSRSAYPCLYVGTKLAEKLDVKEGDVLSLYSPFTGKSVLAIVCAVVPVPYPLSYEILVNLDLARRIRGIGSGYFSIAVVHAEDPEAFKNLLAKVGSPKPAELSLARRALLLLLQRGGGLSFEVLADIPETYIARLGIQRELIFLAAYSAIVVVALSCPLIGYAISLSARGCSLLLRQLGASRRSLLAALTTLTVVYVIGATISAVLALHGLNWLARLEVLSHDIYPRINPQDILAVAAAQLLLVLVGVVHGYSKLE